MAAKKGKVFAENAKSAASEARFRALFDSLPEAVFIESLDFKVIDCNESALRLTGYSKDELLGMSAEKLVPPSLAKRFPEILREVVERGVFQAEVLNRGKGGEFFPAFVTIRLVDAQPQKFVYVIVRDISRQKASEAELRESEEKYRLLLEEVGVAVIVADFEERRISDCNSKASELTGYSHDELLSMRVDDLLPPAAIAKLPTGIAQMKAGGSYTFSGEILRKDGEPLRASIRHSVRKGEGGKRFVFCVFNEAK